MIYRDVLKWMLNAMNIYFIKKISVYFGFARLHVHITTSGWCMRYLINVWLLRPRFISLKVKCQWLGHDILRIFLLIVRKMHGIYIWSKVQVSCITQLRLKTCLDLLHRIDNPLLKYWLSIYSSTFYHSSFAHIHLILSILFTWLFNDTSILVYWIVKESCVRSRDILSGNASDQRVV